MRCFNQQVFRRLFFRNNLISFFIFKIAAKKAMLTILKQIATALLHQNTLLGNNLDFNEMKIQESVN